MAVKTVETAAARLTCPSCGRKAKRVSTVTMGALLRDELARPLVTNGRGSCDTDRGGCRPVKDDTGWRFCEAPNCDVVYFSEEGDAHFTKSQLKAPVGVKETSGERPLCYCFGHSVASIKDELRTKGRCDALDDIRAKMKEPGCRCEVENPSGSCCLGSVARGITIAQAELGMPDGASSAGGSARRASVGRGEIIAKLGTVVSAIMASACCWLPLVLLAVGVSGAGIATTLEAYRPVFIVVTFGFLGAAFYFTYRPKKVAGSASSCCSTVVDSAEGCCEPQGKRPFGVMALNKVMLWVVTVFAVAFLLFPTYVSSLLGTGRDGTITENMNTAVFKVDGMTCEGCASIAEEAIRNVPGVLAVEVNYETGRAVVGTEMCCPIPHDEIIEALGSAGYEAQRVEPAASLLDLSGDARELKDAFNAAKRRVRIVMLVSPG